MTALMVIIPLLFGLLGYCVGYFVGSSAALYDDTAAPIRDGRGRTIGAVETGRRS